MCTKIEGEKIEGAPLYLELLPLHVSESLKCFRLELLCFLLQKSSSYWKKNTWVLSINWDDKRQDYCKLAVEATASYYLIFIEKRLFPVLILGCEWSIELIMITLPSPYLYLTFPPISSSLTSPDPFWSPPSNRQSPHFEHSDRCTIYRCMQKECR